MSPAGLVVLRRIARAVARARPASPSSLAAIASLAIGVGLSTAMASLFYVSIVDPLPVPEAENVWELSGASYPRFTSAEEWFGRAPLLESVSSFRFGRRLTRVENRTLRIQVAEVSKAFFSVFRVQPARGELLTGRGEDATRAVLSYEFWSSALGADKDVIGRPLAMGGRSFVVTGIAARGFGFPAGTDVWIAQPPDGRPAIGLDMTEVSGTSFRFATAIVGRSRAGADEAALTDEIVRLQRELERINYPNARHGSTVTVRSLGGVLSSRARATMLLLAAGCGVVLLTAVANFSHLVLLRTIDRSRDLALRRALGASSLSLFSLLLAENGVLAVLGCGAALVIATAALALVRPGIPEVVPNVGMAAVGEGALLSCVGFVLLVVVAVSAVAALRGSQRDTAALVRSSPGSPGSGLSAAGRDSLLAGQIGFAVSLLVCATLLFTALLKLQSSNPGFVSDGVVTAELGLAERADEEHVAARWEAVRGKLATLPGVESAALTDRLPLSGPAARTFVETAGGSASLAVVRHVSGAYFRVFGIPLVSGEGLAEAHSAGVAVVNSECARALGHAETDVGWTMDVDGVPHRVVGVVPPVAEARADDAPVPQAYVPLAPGGVTRDSIFVALKAPKGTTLSARAMDAAVRSLDPGVLVGRVRTAEDLAGASLAQPRLRSVVSSLFGGVGAIAVFLGVYASVADLTARRAREFAIRSALGCTPLGILLSVVSSVSRPLLAGLGCGVLAAVAASRWMAALAFGVDALAPPAVAAGATAVALAVVAAAAAPAFPLMNADLTRRLRED